MKASRLGKAMGKMGLLAAASSALLLAADPAQTQESGGLGTHDSSQPIEIVADKLTVEQSAGRAVFVGNVLAEQGEMVLRADQLIVYYQAGDDAATSTQSIRRIEVEGNVTISSTAETAVGDRGFYDVVGEHIELSGNVVLTRESNVISGDLLEIDVAQQVATMTATESQPSGARVRALFQPSQEVGTRPAGGGEG